MKMKDYISKVKDFERYSVGLYALIERYDLQGLFDKELLSTLADKTFPNVENNSLVLMAETIEEGNDEMWNKVVETLMDSDDETHLVISSMLANAITAITQYEAMLSLTSESLNRIRGEF